MSIKRQALGRGLAALIPAAAGPTPTAARPAVPAMPPPAPPAAGAPATTVAAGGVAPTAVTSAVVPRFRWAPAWSRARGCARSASRRCTRARHQPRKTFDDARLDELAASIRTQGLIEPLVVRLREAGGYEIIAGERRWRAAQRAGLHAVPVVIRDVAPARAFELAIVENLQREDLNPIEEAEGFDRLIREFGYTQESLAARVGKDRTTVSNALRLLKLPPGVRGLVIGGRLSMGHARAILGLESLGAAPASADGGAAAAARSGAAPSPATIAEQMEQLARRVVARELSVRQVEALVRREKDAALTTARRRAATRQPARPSRPPRRAIRQSSDPLAGNAGERRRVRAGPRASGDPLQLAGPAGRPSEAHHGMSAGR